MARTVSRRSHRASWADVDSGDTRREHNQLLFRKANERLLAAVGASGSTPDRLPFLCECADEDCLATVYAKVDEWKAVARRHNHFLMNAGHQHSEGEKVIGHVGEYEIARKPD